MTPTVIDYETYYDKDNGPSASTQGTYNYVHDPRAYAYIMSVHSDDFRWVGTIEDALKHPVVSSEAFWKGRQLWAAHSNFDAEWSERYFPASVGTNWKCVLDLGATEQLPHNLAGMCQVKFGVKADKRLRDWMNRKHWADLDAERKAEMLRYCAEDARLEYELIRKLPTPSATEQALAEHTRMINRRGVRINVALAETFVERLKQSVHEAHQQLPWREADAPLSRPAFDRYCKERGIAVPRSLAQTDPECAQMCAADPRLNQIVQAVRQYRKSNVNVGKIQAILDRTRPDGMMPMDLIFCGARHTRRWVSRGVNVHNLAKEAYELDEDDEENYVWTRELLIPREGQKFLIADYSQIEPRCLQWLVGNEPLLAAIRSGMNIYEAYARFSGQWSDSGPLNKHTNTLLYASMKEQVLGLGYGMGADKYFLTTQKKGLPFTAEECAKSVKDFRARNKGIVSLWYQMDDVIKRAACKDHELSVELPTGEPLRYFEVKATQDRSYQGINTRGVRHGNSLQKSLWGGTLTENVVQRMARDVLGDAILRLESAGFPVMFHAHDEVILEVDENVDEREARREVEAIMGKEPAWARGLPLGVEAQFATHYLK